MPDLFRVVWATTGKPATDLEWIALNCEWAKGLLSCDMEGFAVEWDGTLVLLDECGTYRYPPGGVFRVEWLSADPIPMFLTCPQCGERHIDEGEFATKPHHTHACQACGLAWRPAIVPTVGVRFLPGFKNAT